MTTNQIEKCLDLELSEEFWRSIMFFLVPADISKETLASLKAAGPGRVIRMKKGERIEYL